MSDESFIREVEEELRSERLGNFWKKYKIAVIGGAIAIVVATAGYRGWNYYSSSVAAASGAQFQQAIELSNDGKHEEAIKALEQLAAEGTGQYPALAKMRMAGELANDGKGEEAIKAFDAIANDTGFDEILRDIARLRAGLLLVDTGTYDQVADRLQNMADTGKPYRHSAREGLGLAAWKAKKYKDALVWFDAIIDDTQSPAGVRQRAAIMIQLLAGVGVTSTKEES